MAIRKLNNIFSFVLWNKLPVHLDYFKSSIIVLENEHDGIGPSNFIAVQTILCRRPFTQMKLNLQGFDEMVLTTCPIILKHSL